MARMFPKVLPSTVESAAERLLFDELARQLSDDYVVIYGVKWLRRERQHFHEDGEIDFLIVHPGQGLLILEVKGGGIQVEDGRWYSIDRFGDVHAIKNPLEQAGRSLHALKNKLAEMPVTRPYSYRLQRGVVLPNVTLGSARLGIDAPREIIIDSSDLYGLEAAVRRIMADPPPGYGLPSAAIDALVDTLRPSVELTTPGLARQLLEGERLISRLTESQYQVLDTLRKLPRAAIAGCAGSGKTSLAIEKARRLAREGYSVLFTCFNKKLAEWVQTQLDAMADPSLASVRVANFHRLAADIHEEVTGEKVWNEQAGSEFFDETLPEYLDAAIPSLPYRFDAIIADEGQDFAPLWWLPLQELLADPQRGVFYIFYDDNQSIYGHRLELPVDLLEIPLDTNCRNTRCIHEYVLRYYHGDHPPRANGPDGRPPEFVEVNGGGQREALRRTLDRLVRQEGIPVSNVVVLTPNSRARSGLKDGTRVGNLTLSWDQQPGARAVRVSTIHSFKGLESPIVILAELDPSVGWHRNNELLYVATSRARGHLIILGELPPPQG
jgi:hypothetical protein